MTLTFLGTGTSTGVPQIGCPCPVCTSSDPRDTRLRTSAIVEVSHDLRILIDCGPDFRQQMLRYGFKPFNAVMLTHEHYDHVGGIDDLRPFSLFSRVPLYADALCASHLRQRLPYCFGEHLYPGVPQIDLRVATPGEPITITSDNGYHSVDVLPLSVMHDRLPILGYRIGNLGYITDATAIAPETERALQGVDVLVVNALRFTPHHSHQTLPQAIEMSRRIGAQRTYFIHMSHQIGLHAEVDAQLPPNMHLAYDGLQVEVGTAPCQHLKL